MRERRPSGWSPSGTDYSWIETQRRRRRADDGFMGRTIGMDLCWCGEEKFHAWEGKADGKPHPPAKETP